MTDKIKFTVGGESHELPIDSSKTPRVGNVSPDMKLTVAGAYTPTTKIMLGSGKEPAMTIHPDGKITLGENAQPTEAAAECINAMSHMIQAMIRSAVEAENERLNINGIHSCHDQCARPLCVAWRENERLREWSLKTFTVVEWVSGEGKILSYPYYDADDLLGDGVELLGVYSSDDARAALGETK